MRLPWSVTLSARELREDETNSDEDGEALLDALNIQSCQKQRATCFLVSKFIVTQEYVMEVAKTFVVLFNDSVVDGPFQHFDKTYTSAHAFSIVFDFIVCPIRRQNKRYNERSSSVGRTGSTR